MVIFYSEQKIAKSFFKKDNFVSEISIKLPPYTLYVVINENSWLDDGNQQIHALPLIGTHTGLYIKDNNDNSNSILYDPNGSYIGRNKEPRGSGDFFIGNEFDFKEYIKYQYEDGCNINIYEFNLSQEEGDRIIQTIVNGNCSGSFSCTVCTSQALISGGGTFKELEVYTRPKALGDALREIIKEGNK